MPRSVFRHVERHTPDSISTRPWNRSDNVVVTVNHGGVEITTGKTGMDDIKATSAEHHDEAAHNLEIAAKMHRDAAKQCMSGNFEKAQSLATSAAEADNVANRHAMQALDLYRHHAEEVQERKAELAAEEAARELKHEAKDAKG